MTWIPNGFLCVSEGELTSQESRLLDSLINEIVVETALDAHASVKRSRGTCIHCGQKYV